MNVLIYCASFCIVSERNRILSFTMPSFSLWISRTLIIKELPRMLSWRKLCIPPVYWLRVLYYKEDIRILRISIHITITPMVRMCI